MKRILLPVFILALTSLHAQQKHDNAILIPGATLKQAISAFMDAGLQIDKYDTIMEFVYSAPKQTGSTIMQFSARIKDSILVITGKVKSSVSFSKMMMNDRQNAIDDSNNYFAVECKGMSGSDIRKAWDQMDKIAKSFGQPVSYAKL